MAAAESCTGGWISKCCTDLAGSSDWFDRGFVTYCNEAKVDMLGVGEQALADHGAVSEAVVRQMAQGARHAAGVETSLAVTGVAGPGGGSKEKPVGMVWFAWDIAGSETSCECMHFEGDRQSVRYKSVLHALEGLLNRVSRTPEIEKNRLS